MKQFKLSVPVGPIGTAGKRNRDRAPGQTITYAEWTNLSARQGRHLLFRNLYENSARWLGRKHVADPAAAAGADDLAHRHAAWRTTLRPAFVSSWMG